jgi:hypothetical protein
MLRPLQNQLVQARKPAYDHHVPGGFRGPDWPRKGGARTQPLHRALAEDTSRTQPLLRRRSSAVSSWTCGPEWRRRSSGSRALRRRADAETLVPRPCIPNSVDPAESATLEIGGLRSFAQLASATLLEATFANERDDATRLAKRCYLQPHSFAPLDNSLLRLRLSSSRSITDCDFTAPADRCGATYRRKSRRCCRRD